jgi:hypothetical protein
MWIPESDMMHARIANVKSFAGDGPRTRLRGVQSLPHVLEPWLISTRL